MTDLRNVKWYLSMEITRLPPKNQVKDQKKLNQGHNDQENQDKAQNEAILLTQTKYIRDLLARHGMEECAPVATSMTEIKLKKAPSGYKCLEKQLKAYQILLSELMHLMIQTRPDLAYSISRLVQFMSNPIDDH